MAALNNRYVPALRQATQAGWQPVSMVRSSDPEVWLERWGPAKQGEVYLTVYNSAPDQRAVVLTVAAAKLGLTGRVTAADLLSDAKAEAPVKGGIAELRLTAPARRLMVLRLGGE